MAKPKGTLSVPVGVRAQANARVVASPGAADGAGDERIRTDVAPHLHKTKYTISVKACNAADECSAAITATSGSSSCQPPAAFKDAVGMCRECPSGKQTLTVDATSCMNLCAAGTYLEVSNADGCQSMTIASCPAGQAFSSASAGAVDGPYPLLGATVNDGQCSACAPGYFKGGAATAARCTPCAKGMFAGPGTGATMCTLCPAGKYNDVASGGVAACAACPEGTFRADTGAVSQDECIGCYSGRYSDSAAGAAACTECPAGKNNKDNTGTPTLHNSEFSCIECAAGAYNPFPGLGTECFPCLSAKSTGETECSGCDPGKWKDSANDACNLCEVGKFTQDRDIPQCQDCPRGWYALASRPFISCAVCPRGTFGVVTAAVNATLGCLDCVAGRYSEDFGLEIDTLVDPNDGGALPAATIAAAACKACPKGRWSAASGIEKESLCLNCPPGTHGSTVGSASTNASCLKCAAGKFGTAIGAWGEADTCTACPSGFA